MDANQLRKIWIDFFTERGHVLVPSASLIPTHPTAPLFTNSGMMQFVPYFLREEEPPWPRAQSVQKCVRISGKHNDVDELGKTRRHLSFFEMLGNWSFGDYFKEDAIKMAWDLVVEKIGMDGDRIWPTVHVTDDDAEAIWHETIGIPLERIQRLGDKENFWEMGATGPCGPCSELHYDCGPEWGAEGGPEHGDSDRYVEFWNLVFMDQFRDETGALSPLPNKNVDTGGGLERFLMLLESSPTVYDTEALMPLVRTVESIAGKPYGAGTNPYDAAIRVVADHGRTMAFLIDDGIPPSNEERGYVVRSVIRRAITKGQQLGIDRPFLPELLTAVFDLMGEAYPELRAHGDGIIATIEREEHRFRQTLAQGSALLEDELQHGKVTGAAAFKLHDTYGFPIEVTREIAEERGVDIDLAGFDAAMQEQRQRAKSARKAGVIDKEALDTYRAIVGEHGTTEFTGREEYESKATVLAVLPLDDGTVEVFLDRTPFYAESGGQIGDTGTISTDTGRAEVLDTTYAVPNLYRHVARIVEGEIEPGQQATAAIDADRRDAIRRNHTGTHLLHWALRKVAGDHVKQQGSLVHPDYLRFDFSHYEGLTPEQLREVEDLANAVVLHNEPVKHYETTKEQALEAGAIAFFGDKYGEIVRVLEAGPTTELCGGTHVRATGDIGPIRITSEGSIGSNQRRIFATTGTATIERLRTAEETLQSAAGILNVGGPEEVLAGVERLREEAKALRDELKALRKQAAGSGAAALAAQAVDGVVVARQDGMGRDDLKDLAVAVRDQPGIRGVVLIGEPDTGGVALIGATTKDSGLNASALIADAAKATGGGGGKDPLLATAGGRDATKIDEALALARTAAGL
ncbi:MAG TPA: alanine--tRNA ligase [Acidimicrobiales bacterium]|nr:alanine--tRNA ligase [Acidimicrobiales bacterium]